MTQDEYKIDSHKLIYHPQRVAQWMDAGDDWEKAKKVYPIYLEISPSGSCNHRCIFCALDYVGYKPVNIDLNIMERVVSEMGECGVKSVMFAGEGEPFMFKNIDSLVSCAVNSGIDVAFTTNGVLFNQNHVENSLHLISWIKVSIDAGTANTYASIHNTNESDFASVINNLKYAVKYRERNSLKCALGAQFLLLPDNFKEADILAKICRDDIGLDYLVIKSHSQHRFSNNKQFDKLNYAEISEEVEKTCLLSTDKFKVIYRAESVKKHINNQILFNECNAVPFYWAYIMANLDLYACSAFLTDNRFFLGNLKENSFKDVWEGDKRRRVFEMMKNDFNISECRINCRMNSVNLYLEELRNPHSHVNFI